MATYRVKPNANAEKAKDHKRYICRKQADSILLIGELGI